MAKYDAKQFKELILQMVETERGGEQVYRTAIECAVNDDLRKEWGEYLEETLHHQQVIEHLARELEIDPEEQSPGRKVVRFSGESLVKMMRMAQTAGDAKAAQLVACECVVLAETKDQTNWELLGKVGESATGKAKNKIDGAVEEVGNDEEHHYYHTKGWCRELWIDSLGMPAVLPPPEEKKKVETAIGAARAEQQRDKML